jgi:hypothetical protein
MKPSRRQQRFDRARGEDWLNTLATRHPEAVQVIRELDRVLKQKQAVSTKEPCMPELIMPGGRRVNPDQFYRHALATAKANHDYVEGTRSASTARQMAREALGEAYSSVDQAGYFACVDALGGEQAVIDRIVTDMGYGG